MKTYKILARIILLFVFSLSTLISFSQKKEITQNLLINKTWKMYEITDKNVEDIYNHTDVKHYYNRSLIGESIYYLSNEIESNFNESKVGKHKSGKYIISKVKGASNSNFIILELISLNKNKMILRNIKQKHLLKYSTK